MQYYAVQYAVMFKINMYIHVLMNLKKLIIILNYVYIFISYFWFVDVV